MAKPGVREIARLAGVSPATVSNALNGKEGVSRAVAEKVLSIAGELGYTARSPKAAERSPSYVRLVVFRSHGVVLMDTAFFAQLIEYVEAECKAEGLELIITHVTALPDTDYVRRVREICEEDCSGILLLGTEMRREELSLFASCRSPLLVLDNACPGLPMHSVVMDNAGAAELGVRTLYEAGHRRIDHITSAIRFQNIEDREAGFFRALQSVGLSPGEARVWRVTPSIEGAYRDMKQLLASGRPLPTAFFAANDLMSIGCMRALIDAGIRIPQDVSIIGMDDTEVSLACTPPLTTVHVHRRQLAMTAIRMLLHVVPATHEGYTQAQVTVQTVLRDSVRTLSPSQQQEV